MGRSSTRSKVKHAAKTAKKPKKQPKREIAENASKIGEYRGPNIKESLRECEMGITEFLHDRPGFAGVLKARYSDFQVNEIDLSGKVLHLDDLSVPKTAAAPKHTVEEIVNIRNTVKDFVSNAQWERIEKLAGMSRKPKGLPTVEIDVTALEKDQRTEIHQVIKTLYEGNLVSCTAKPEDTSNKAIEKVVKIMKRVGRTEDRWSHEGVFVHFLVYKENIDTADAASKLADRLSIRNSQINYAGNKDRRAITVQKMSVKRREPSHILHAANAHRGIHVGNYEFCDAALKLGDLSGNRFRIALRHITADEADIVAALEHVRDNGFIHYYGLQRFGNNTEVPTHTVGVALLQGEYKTACELILKPRKSDLPYMREIRKYWWETRDATGALAKFRGGNKSVEKKLLGGLECHHGNDYVSALKHIPRNLLMLYPHAFQSLIFNLMASRRIKEFGLKLIPGDLVLREEHTNTPADDIEGDEMVANPVGGLIEESMFKRKVKALTQEDIDSQAYTIGDVVLPLPGFDITYPANIVGEWYEESLKSYQLSSEKMKSNVKELAMGGSYRKLLMKPGDMTWEFRSYKHKDTKLILSDYDKIQGHELAANEGELKALILEFSLPTSGYATMLLRELMKMDTSAASQIDIEADQLKKCNWQEPVGEDKDDDKASCSMKIDNAAALKGKKSHLNEEGETIVAEEKTEDSEMPENEAATTELQPEAKKTEPKVGNTVDEKTQEAKKSEESKTEVGETDGNGDKDAKNGAQATELSEVAAEDKNGAKNGAELQTDGAAKLAEPDVAMGDQDDELNAEVEKAGEIQEEIKPKAVSDEIEKSEPDEGDSAEDVEQTDEQKSQRKRKGSDVGAPAKALKNAN